MLLHCSFVMLPCHTGQVYSTVGCTINQYTWTNFSGVTIALFHKQRLALVVIYFMWSSLERLSIILIPKSFDDDTHLIFSPLISISFILALFLAESITISWVFLLLTIILLLLHHWTMLFAVLCKSLDCLVCLYTWKAVV